MDPTISQTPTPMPTPVPEPAAPVMPVMPQAAAPVAQPVAPTVPAMPEMAIPEPVAPVINPTGTVGAVDAVTSPAPANAAEPAAMPDLASAAAEVAASADAIAAAPIVTPTNTAAGMAPSEVNSLGANAAFFQTNTNGLADTAPLTMPEAPAAPDPVEEELKAPLKPAAPVPGSIGSSISGPASNTPSVAFNDPAMENTMANTALPAKKKGGKVGGGKMSKTTLILLCVVGGMVVLALAVVLITQIM